MYSTLRSNKIIRLRLDQQQIQEMLPHMSQIDRMFVINRLKILAAFIQKHICVYFNYTNNQNPPNYYLTLNPCDTGVDNQEVCNEMITIIKNAPQVRQSTLHTYFQQYYQKSLQQVQPLQRMENLLSQLYQILQEIPKQVNQLSLYEFTLNTQDYITWEDCTNPLLGIIGSDSLFNNPALIEQQVLISLIMQNSEDKYYLTKQRKLFRCLDNVVLLHIWEIKMIMQEQCNEEIQIKLIPPNKNLYFMRNNIPQFINDNHLNQFLRQNSKYATTTNSYQQYFKQILQQNINLSLKLFRIIDGDLITKCGTSLLSQNNNELPTIQQLNRAMLDQDDDIRMNSILQDQDRLHNQLMNQGTISQQLLQVGSLQIDWIEFPYIHSTQCDYDLTTIMEHIIDIQTLKCHHCHIEVSYESLFYDIDFKRYYECLQMRLQQCYSRSYFLFLEQQIRIELTNQPAFDKITTCSIENVLILQSEYPGLSLNWAGKQQQQQSLSNWDVYEDIIQQGVDENESAG